MKNLLARGPELKKFFSQNVPELSSHSFINIFLWKDFFDFDFKVFDGHLCVFAQNEVGCFLYLPPLGRGYSQKSVEESFAHMRSINGGNRVSRIENICETQKDLYPSDRYRVSCKSQEYVYLRTDIVELKGQPYKSKRWAYNQFIKKNTWDESLFDGSMRKDCLKLYDSWAYGRKRKNSDDIYGTMIDENRVVHDVAMKHYQDLELIGRVVIVNGQIKGYTFGYPLGEETFCVLFEITDLNVSGLSVFIFRDMCRYLPERFKWINVMDDFGMENVKKTKESFRPEKIISSYTVTEKEKA